MSQKSSYEELEQRVKDLEKEVFKHKQTEKVLRESEEKYLSLVETTNDWVWEVDQNGVYTYVGPKIKDLLGYEAKQVIGKTPFDLMPSDEAERVGGLFRDKITSCEPFEGLENTNLHKDGQRIVLETSGVPIFDKAGNLTGFRG
ncbi:MAG: PAS domain S-box protein, partial [Deltaproteobacteria bacterium]|nr:PAS domain S-box protein [Deltaproteobacteria bacterium]